MKHIDILNLLAVVAVVMCLVPFLYIGLYGWFACGVASLAVAVWNNWKNTTEK